MLEPYYPTRADMLRQIEALLVYLRSGPGQVIGPWPMTEVGIGVSFTQRMLRPQTPSQETGSGTPGTTRI